MFAKEKKNTSLTRQCRQKSFINLGLGSLQRLNPEDHFIGGQREVPGVNALKLFS
jgi:hypothetical protein